MSDHSTGKQIQSTVRADGTLKIALETVPTPEPESSEVVVRVEASPINPSDLGLLCDTDCADRTQLGDDF